MKWTEDQAIKDRRALCGEGVTLDGKAAVVHGALCPFAFVTELGTERRAEYAWPAVARIVADGGRFTS